MVTEIDQTFLKSLWETVEWCKHLERSGRPFWGKKLKPSGWLPGMNEPPDDHPIDVEQVRYLITKRRKLLTGVRLGERPTLTDVHQGIFVLLDPAGELTDRSAEVISNEFYDEANTPAYDCWVAWITGDEFRSDTFATNYLLSWVPYRVREYILGSEGINPKRCVNSENASSRFLTALREEGLIKPAGE